MSKKFSLPGTTKWLSSRIHQPSHSLKVGEVLLEVTSLVRTHHVQPDPVFTTLVCAIVVLEGLGRQLDPTLDLFSVGLPLLVGA